MLAATQLDALPSRFSRVTTDGKLVWRSEYLGPPPSPRTDRLILDDVPRYSDPQAGEVRSPQAFLVEQEAGAVVPPHFHYVDQFQVVVAGAGLLGRHAVAPLSVHFAAAHTGYGPIQPGEGGLAYFTFRASADETGAQYLPAARSRMRAGPRRNVVVPRIEVATPTELARLSQGEVVIALDEPGGLAVCTLLLPAGGSLQAPDAAHGHGASMLVVAGALSCAGRLCTAWSCLHVSMSEGAVSLHAGTSGAQVLYLRYPKQTSTV
jgi:hypothetical protein